MPTGYGPARVCMCPFALSPLSEWDDVQGTAPNPCCRTAVIFCARAPKPQDEMFCDLNNIAGNFTAITVAGMDAKIATDQERADHITILSGSMGTKYAKGQIVGYDGKQSLWNTAIVQVALETVGA